MYTSTNTRAGPTTSTEATTTYTSTSPYVTHTDFDTTIVNVINELLSKFDDKPTKQDSKFKETIADQDAKFDAKFEKQLQNLSLQIKDNSTKFSLKLDDQDTKISFLATSFNNCLEKIIVTN